MAFEVARVHGLILSNVGEDGSPISPTSGEMQHFDSLQTPAKFNYDPVGHGQRPVTAGSPQLSSPCFAESESDEDDELLASLTEKVVLSIPEDGEEAAFMNGSAKVDWPSEAWLSPEADTQQAAISPPSNWSPGSWVSPSTSSNRSSRVSSQGSSPPTTPLSVQTNAWDLLYVASCEVMRQKMDQKRAMLLQARTQQHQAHQAQQRAQAHWPLEPPHSEVSIGCIGGKDPQRLSSPSSASTMLGSCAPMSSRAMHPRVFPEAQRGFNARGREEDRKSSSLQSRSSKLVQAAGWARHSKAQAGTLPHSGRLGNIKKGYSQHRSARMMDCHPPHWLNVPIANGGSGMRAVFLGANGSGRESGGTGVFLPRTAGGGSDYKQKPACSTVLLPNRLVQVLNLNVEDIRSNSASPCAPMHPSATRSELPVPPPLPFMMGTAPLQNPKMCHAQSWAMSHGKQLPLHLRQQSAACVLSLPTEWTY